jgi:hypothetical protein
MSTSQAVTQAVTQVVNDVQSDISATEAAVENSISPLAAQARAEYDTLEPAAQSRIHQLLNDLEVTYHALPAMHTFFGAKK